MACGAHVPANKALINSEYDRKAELERRRVLRLLQVREQSKDFADKLRSSIQAEMRMKRNSALKSKIKHINQSKKVELGKIKESYEKCFKNIGESHREAAKQPNINFLKELEAAQISSEAAVRGAKARKQQIAEKVIHDRNIQAPIEQKRLTRNRENIRSNFVSNLPKRSTNQERNSRSPDKPLTSCSTQDKSVQVVSDIPSNVNISQFISTDRREPQQLQNHSEPSNKKCFKTDEEHQDNPTFSKTQSECSSHYIICACHNSKRGSRRRCLSESTLASDHTLYAKKPKLRSRSCSSTGVRTLNFCTSRSVYESKEQNFTKVTHHPKPIQSNIQDQTKPTNIDSITTNKQEQKQLLKKTEERCAKALKREQLKKDFQQLLQDLENVSRGKSVANIRKKSKARVYQKERDVLSKKESKQKKLVEAFEVLIKSVQQISTLNRDQRNYLKSPPSDYSSPPTLNLATYHDLDEENAREPLPLRSVVELPYSDTPSVMCSEDTSQSTDGYLKTMALQSRERYFYKFLCGNKNDVINQNPLQQSEQNVEKHHTGLQHQKRNACDSRTNRHYNKICGTVIDQDNLQNSDKGVGHCIDKQNAVTYQPGAGSRRTTIFETLHQGADMPQGHQYKCEQYLENVKCSQVQDAMPSFCAERISPEDTSINKSRRCKQSRSHHSVQCTCKEKILTGPDHQNKPQSSSPDSVTSYCSVPDQLNRSNNCLDSLLHRPEKNGLDKELSMYIQKLLNMSRLSIENLSASLDSVSSCPSSNLEEGYNLPAQPTLETPDFSENALTPIDEEIMKEMVNLLNEYTDRVNELVNSLQEVDNCSSSSQHMEPPEHISSAPLPSLTHPTAERSRCPSPAIERSLTPQTTLPSQLTTPQKAQVIKTFGLSTNILPNPADIHIPNFQDQLYRSLQHKSAGTEKSVCPSTNDGEDLDALLFEGLSPMPTLNSSPVNTHALYLEKLGYDPEEEVDNVLDKSEEWKKLNLRFQKIRDRH